MTADAARALFGPVADDLARVEDALRAEIAADPPEVGAPMEDLFEAGGKRIRPALLLLCGACGRYDRDALVPAAMAVEVVHAATLVHDDVIDRSPTRRGRPTVAASLGDEPAIVVGDFYFARAYELAARAHQAEVVAILAHAVMDVCAGEVRQQDIRFRYSTDVGEYMARIRAKTATLLAACCEIGALLGGLDARSRAALTRYGHEIGLAFQIADDVLDYMGDEDEVGKPTGHDIEEGFATLPLMLALEDGASADELARILTDGRRLPEDQARRVAELVRASDAPGRAIEIANDHARQARRQLGVISRSEAHDALDALEALAAYVVTRKL